MSVVSLIRVNSSMFETIGVLKVGRQVFCYT